MEYEFSAPPRRGPADVNRDIVGALICVALPAPSIAAWWVLTRMCGPAVAVCGGHDGSLLAEFCAFGLAHPIALVNVLFFFNVCVAMWIISLIQRSAWLIDPYWTIIPVLIGHFYATHPLADADSTRTIVVLGVVWIWSLRLTHNYFRRERWRFGAREDWRFAQWRERSRHFWWFSFFYAFLSQQVMLVGLTLPLWAVSVHPEPFVPIDAALALVALIGVRIAQVADRQLHDYMEDKRRRRAMGLRAPGVLDAGLWRLSRHPNYFGELLFWWALAGYGVRLGETWTVFGAAVNTLVMATVTVMTERRILSVPGRREAYRRYRRETSAWIPWFKRR